MEYPEVVCMRNQMRETLVGKRIERVYVEDVEQYAGTIRETLLTQPPEVFQRQLEGGVLVSVENVSQTLLLAVDTGHTLSLGAIYGAIRFHPTAETLPKRKRPCLQADFSDGTYLNVHTNRYRTGEIRGQITLAPEPTSLLLVSLGLGGLAIGGRRRHPGRPIFDDGRPRKA